MMKKKAIIHIGGHKTGSTSIQKSLLDSSSLLKKENINYPLEFSCKEILVAGQHTLAWNLLGRKNLPAPHLHQTNQALEILNNLKKQNFDLLFSSEEFMWLNEKAINCLKKELIDFDIFVIVYVRRQDEALLALYQTDVIHYGETKTFESWLKNKEHIFNYNSIIKKWEETTNGNIIVRPYDRNLLANGDIIDDFKITLETIFQKNITLIKPKHELNKTLPSSLVNIIRYHNTQPSKEKMVPILSRLGRELSILKQSKDYGLIPPSMKQSILKSFHQGNLELSEKYLGLKTIWFNDVINEKDDDWLEKNSFNGSNLLALINETLEAINFLKSK